MDIYRPGIIAETVLPSITSSRLSSISLHSEDDPEDDFPEADYPAWMVTENNLCRLAKRFSTENPGKKMEVVIFGEAVRARKESFPESCQQYEVFAQIEGRGDI